ncbi:MAG: RAMP superfamily CRISPR-associated protein [Cyanobacterium sp.]
MYQKAYGIIETLAPLHVGASSGEESGNLNLIFRDQFTQTGIIPGSSIRGRFRADMRQENTDQVDNWYGKEAILNEKDSTTEALVKFEYASIVWIPVYCPNQPVVRVSCPALLRRYQKITNKPTKEFTPYSYYGKKTSSTLFFNLGFLPLKEEDKELKDYIPEEISNRDEYLVLIVNDTEISMIHDMALYRQSRVALETDQKKAKTGAFFNVEALPEGTIMTFPLALKKEDSQDELKQWNKFVQDSKISANKDMYFGGLESIGFGRTKVTLNAVEEK